MIHTLLATLILIVIAFLSFGVGVFIFGKKGFRTQCGSVPVAKTEECPSQKAGICPVEDKTGALKFALRSRISHHK